MCVGVSPLLIFGRKVKKKEGHKEKRDSEKHISKHHRSECETSRIHLYTALTSVYLTSFAVFGLNLYTVKRVIPTWWL